ncbi:transient receptor potential ion channel subfamily C trp-like protein [Penaeus vannamei]|uniref:Transient receptor potential ion channel subfamily C trp-like protein n=1 Tax=Penaeus vannamei TaxID=6689 RepID=A0A423UAQ5_PENVA|nr:transient receptor potential ion channel subfamily C trp-like protein [Penaeus vannamei]
MMMEFLSLHSLWPLRQAHGKTDQVIPLPSPVQPPRPGKFALLNWQTRRRGQGQEAERGAQCNYTLMAGSPLTSLYPIPTSATPFCAFLGLRCGRAVLRHREEYVEGVEALLGTRRKIHVAGEAYSWQRKESEKANFTGDITPLILAAHKNNYEIIKLLLDRGATLPMPHDIRCACDECLISSSEDSLRHSLARINAYRALASPSLICLSSKDPLITAFSLSDDLDKLATLEYEFRDEYTALRTQVLEFAMRLVDETRSSDELEIILNYDPEGEPYQKGQFMHLNRLKDAVDKTRSRWRAAAPGHGVVRRMPGFKRRSLPDQLMAVVKIGVLFRSIACPSFWPQRHLSEAP